jgi:hypothetical protein
MAHRILLGTRKGLLTFDRIGSGWKRTGEAFTGGRVSYALRDPRDGRLYACQDHGHWGVKLSLSTDEGKTWQETSVPKYPAGEEVSPGKPAVLKYLWVLEPGSKDEPGRLYAGTAPGGFFVTDDYGSSWQRSEALWNHPTRTPETWFGGGLDAIGIHSILLDPRNPRQLRIGISCAGQYIGEPNGDGDWNWRPSNRGCKADFMPNPDVEVGHDPHLIVQCQTQPDKLWQQNHCGIFRSIDGGESWTQVSTKGSLPHFGFAIAVDPNDGETAWVVPAESDEVRIAVDRAQCIARTTDGGRSWQIFRAGLPQTDCYDFAFRHCLDLSGNELIFGTAGGSLYHSADRGETWTAIANHLPPIYSARFA